MLHTRGREITRLLFFILQCITRVYMPPHISAEFFFSNSIFKDTFRLKTSVKEHKGVCVYDTALTA